MANFTFWHRWLLLASIFLAAFGIFVACFPDSPLLSLWNAAVARRFFDGAVPEQAQALKSFLFGPLGATIAGFYVLQTFIVWNAFRRKEKWAWRAIVAGTLLWFVVDSSRSLYHEAFFNVWMINLPALALSGIPLTMTFRYFYGAAREVDRVKVVMKD